MLNSYDLFGTGETLTELQKLVDRVSLLPWFRNRAELERKAAEIREYESYQIPGLLQTEDYARAIMRVGRPRISSDEMERAVALRMTRQEILEPRDDLPVDQEQTPRYWAIIDESALQRVVGSPEIMRMQLDHLVEMAQRPRQRRRFPLYSHLRSSARERTGRYTNAPMAQRGRDMNWRKSSYSGQSGGNCVEVAGDGRRVLVRDTKNRADVALKFSVGTWRKFASQIKATRLNAPSGQ